MLWKCKDYLFNCNLENQKGNKKNFKNDLEIRQGFGWFCSWVYVSELTYGFMNLSSSVLGNLVG